MDLDFRIADTFLFHKCRSSTRHSPDSRPMGSSPGDVQEFHENAPVHSVNPEAQIPDTVDFNSLDAFPDWCPQYDDLINWEHGVEPSTHEIPPEISGFMTEGSDIDLWRSDDGAEYDSFQQLAESIARDGGSGTEQYSNSSSFLGTPISLDDEQVSSTPATAPTEPKKSRRLPPDAVRILRTWLYQHKSHPYPTESERENLEQQTGLDKTQIRTWFTNARRRKRLSNDVTPADHSLLSPLERWQHSPPESEPAATSAIIRAAESYPYYSDGGPAQGSAGETGSSNSSCSSFQFGAPSMSNYEHSNSSGSGLSVNIPQRPIQRPPTPLPRMRSRRRRKSNKLTSRTAEQKERASRAYQCTFCSDSFRSKYDWRRHEKALHLSVDRWHCAPHGGVIDVDNVLVCAFCRAPGIDGPHLDSHNYIPCREKPPALRSFSRKDHLQQHLRLVHHVPYHPSMDEWRYTISDFQSRCGFCQQEFQTWDERVDHVAEHFKNGADMSSWKGDWGFEPEIERIVENAIPPYLIGQERRTMDPWHGEDAVRNGEGSVDDGMVPNAFYRYTSLRHAIVGYLGEQAAAGVYPSDQMIQDHARLVAYGDDDPWNQTWADDPAWLAALRKDVGLADVGGIG